MYTRLLPALIRSLLTLLFFLDLINASPTRPDLVHNNNNNPQPSLLLRSAAFSPRAVPPPAAPYLLVPRAPTPPTPQQQQHNHSNSNNNSNNHRHEGYIKPLAEAAAGYNLKFKEYSKWIKESSKSIWNKHATTTITTEARTPSSSSKNNNNDKEHYVSPYLTQFADKHDSWWSVGLNFGVMWRHVLWEVVPEWFRGSEPQREDMFLLRAMEQPMYMSVDDLPDVYKPRIGEELDNTLDVDGKVSPVEDVDDSWIYDL